MKYVYKFWHITVFHPGIPIPISAAVIFWIDHSTRRSSGKKYLGQPSSNQNFLRQKFYVYRKKLRFSEDYSSVGL